MSEFCELIIFASYLQFASEETVDAVSFPFFRCREKFLTRRRRRESGGACSVMERRVRTPRGLDVVMKAEEGGEEGGKEGGNGGEEEDSVEVLSRFHPVLVLFIS